MAITAYRLIFATLLLLQFFVSVGGVEPPKPVAAAIKAADAVMMLTTFTLASDLRPLSCCQFFYILA